MGQFLLPAATAAELQSLPPTVYRSCCWGQTGNVLAATAAEMPPRGLAPSRKAQSYHVIHHHGVQVLALLARAYRYEPVVVEL